MDLGFTLITAGICLFLLLIAGNIIPNRIVLISHGRHDEAVSSADIYPGMLLQMNSTNQVAPHAVQGGGGPLMVAEEDAWQGGDITQKILSGNQIPFRRPARGDELLMLLQNGQNVTGGTGLMSAGDGTLMAAVGAQPVTLYQILAASTNITNTSTETTFSNGSYSLAANTLSAGDLIHIQGQVVVSAENSTNTHDVKIYIGGTAFDATALALAAGQYVEFDLYITVRSIGALGKIVAQGTISNNAGGTVAVNSVQLGSTTLDTTAAELIKVTSTASAISTGNIAALQAFRIDVARAVTGAIVYAFEAVNNSGGTGTSGFNSAAFIRTIVP